jgi:hypothetical protein
MEKIGHPDAASLLSQQVSRARYFFSTSHRGKPGR